MKSSFPPKIRVLAFGSKLSFPQKAKKNKPEWDVGPFPPKYREAFTFKIQKKMSSIKYTVYVEQKAICPTGDIKSPNR